MNINETISEHLNQYNLDIRRSHNARFMDQKVTPDVLCFIADCIINHIVGDTTKEFTTKDIWNSQYFEKNVRAIFGKPSPAKKTASSEYDKFIAQPMKTLAYARVLNSEKRGNTIHYTIANYDILEYISIKERNAYLFLYLYLRKVLSDSGFSPHINRFRDACARNQGTHHQFDQLKTRFQRFIIGNTPVNGRTEVNRIFPIRSLLARSQVQAQAQRGPCPIFHLLLTYPVPQSYDQ